MRRKLATLIVFSMVLFGVYFLESMSFGLFISIVLLGLLISVWLTFDAAKKISGAQEVDRNQHGSN